MYRVITGIKWNVKSLQDQQSRLNNHPNSYFGRNAVSKVTARVVQDYHGHRLNGDNGHKPPVRSALHDEIVTLGQVLNIATRRA